MEELLKAANEEIQKLKQVIADKDEELSAIYKVNAEYKEQIEKITTSGNQPKIAVASPIANSTFELDGQQYGFNFPKTKHNGQEVSHIEIASDPVLQKELIEKGAGIIKKID
jgi:hypothetical protein